MFSLTLFAMNLYDELPILREGSWLYDGSVRMRVRLRRSPFTPGTGDYEDPPEIANDRPAPCFFFDFEAPGSQGLYNSSSPRFASPEAAIAYARKTLSGFELDPT